MGNQPLGSRLYSCVVWVAALLALAGCAAERPVAEYGAWGAGAAGGALLLSSSSLGLTSTSAAGAAGGTAAGGGATGATGTQATAGGATISHLGLLRQLGGAALVAYALYDPLAPNWEIAVQPESERVVRIVLTMRPLATGGNGESWRIFQRAAQRVTEQSEAKGYRLLAYEEGVHSTRPFAERYAVGVVELNR
ncbi:hypothetical protein JCM16106_03760 [Hydrogenophilus islandicus]